MILWLEGGSVKHAVREWFHAARVLCIYLSGFAWSLTSVFHGFPQYLQYIYIIHIRGNITYIHILFYIYIYIYTDIYIYRYIHMLYVYHPAMVNKYWRTLAKTKTNRFHQRCQTCIPATPFQAHFLAWTAALWSWKPASTLDPVRHHHGA